MAIWVEPLESCRIRCNGVIKMISHQDIDGLHRWGLVGFTARCAERVLPLSRQVDEIRWSNHLRGLVNEATDNASALAEKPEKAEIEVVRRLARHLDETGRKKGQREVSALDHALVDCAWGMMEVADIAISSWKERRRDAYQVAHSVVRAARVAARHASDRNYDACEAAMEVDCELLNDGIAFGWTDETALPEDTFGPLWPRA